MYVPRLASLHQGREGAASGVVGGHMMVGHTRQDHPVQVLGGWDGENLLDSVEQYSGQAAGWVQVAQPSGTEPGPPGPWPGPDPAEVPALRRHHQPGGAPPAGGLPHHQVPARSHLVAP